MRLPRIRITVGKLILAVAVVAANCWALLSLDNQRELGPWSVTHARLRVGVGVLPLLNVGLIGTWLFVARWVARLQRGHTTSGGRPPGWTYFSLHFLVLWLVIGRFIPDAVAAIGAGVAKLKDILGGKWPAVFGHYGETVPAMILEGLMLAVCLSGVPLLICWVGQRLARRCAATLPPTRFRALSGQVSLGVAFAALAIAVTPRPFEEDIDVVVEFQILEEDSGRPIGAAFVQIVDPFDSEVISPRALTGVDGRAEIKASLRAVGERSAFGTWGTFSPWGRWLIVSSAGHQTARIPLSRAIGPFVGLGEAPVRRVSLARGKTRGDTCRDIAGTYRTSRNGFYGRWFTIEPDGRFAWCSWGCTHQVYEYGYLERQRSGIRLQPLPHPDRETSPTMSLKHRVIAWGERLYLSAMEVDELGEFCRAALTPGRTTNSDGPYPGYLRFKDGQRPQSGMPHLPWWAWVAFLCEDPSARDEDGVSKSLLDTLNLWRPAEGPR